MTEKEKKPNLATKVIEKLLEPKSLITLEIIAGTVNMIAGITAPTKELAMGSYIFSGAWYLNAGLTIYIDYKAQKDKPDK